MNDYGNSKKKSKLSTRCTIIMLGIISMSTGYFVNSFLNQEEWLYKTPEPSTESIQLNWYNQNVDWSDQVTWETISWYSELIYPENWGHKEGDDMKSIITPRSNSIKKTKKDWTQSTNQGYSRDQIESVLIKVWEEVGINPTYFKIIWWTENLANPDAVWDWWCSFWAYQFNKCAGKGRENQVWFWKKFEDCSKDIECSTRMLADKMRNVYNCEFNDWRVEDYRCLYKHQGVTPDGRYMAKIDKQYSLYFTKW